MSDTIESLVSSGLLDKDFLDIPDCASNTTEATETTEDNDSHYEGYHCHNIRKSISQPPKFTHIPKTEHNLEDDILVVNMDYTNHNDNVSNDADQYQYYRETSYHWLFSSKSAGWWHFTQPFNDKLEQAYQSDESSIVMTIGGRKIIVDFTDMTQRCGGSSRNILRIETLKDINLRGIGSNTVSKTVVLRPPRNTSLVYYHSKLCDCGRNEHVDRT